MTSSLIAIRSAGVYVLSLNTSSCFTMAKGQIFSEPSMFLTGMQGMLILCSRVDFAHSTTEELEALSQACQPASFGLNNKDVLDETYRKAGKMDLDAFATLLDPRSLGIHDIIERDLLATDQAVEFELSKLNVYGKPS